MNQTGVRAVQMMNISLQQFRQLTPEQQFDLVAQKFAGYSHGANKAALATALFGKSGADLMQTRPSCCVDARYTGAALRTRGFLPENDDLLQWIDTCMAADGSRENAPGGTC